MAAVAGARGKPPSKEAPSPADLEQLKGDCGKDLKKMSRSDLQTLAKKLHIVANLKSEVIIEQIAQQRFDFGLKLANEVEGLMCMHIAAMKTLVTKAEASAMALGLVGFSRRAVYEQTRATLLKEYDGLSCDDKAEEMEVLSQPVCIPVVPQVSEPIFVGNIPTTAQNEELQKMFNIKDPVERFGRGGCCAKLFVPIDKVHQVLSQDSSLCGRKLRVAKWMAPVAHVAKAAGIKSRDGRGRNQTSNATCSVSAGNSAKDARFVADFLAAQARPGGDRQLYSRVLAPDKTAQRRMESMETAIKQILERLSKAS